jgi:hypothetical protein
VNGDTPRFDCFFFLLKKKGKKMTRGKKTEEGQMHCACVEDSFPFLLFFLLSSVFFSLEKRDEWEGEPRSKRENWRGIRPV